MAFQLLTLAEVEQQAAGNAGAFFSIALGQLRDAKQAIQRGQMTISEYFEQAEPVAKRTVDLRNFMTTQGTNSANFANQHTSGLGDFVEGTGDNGAGDFRDIKAPFTSREFASLPRAVLPTSDEINQGLIPVDLLPPGAFEKVSREERLVQEEERAAETQRQEEERQKLIDEGKTPTDGRLPEPTSTGTNFADQIREISSLPQEDQQQALFDLVTGINESRETNRVGSTLERIAGLDPLTQEDALIDLVSRIQAENKAKDAGKKTIQVPDPQNPGRFIDVPIVGDVDDRVVPQSQDQSIIEAEARRQEEQRRREFEATRALREEALTDLGSQLDTQRGRAFEQFVPEAADQLQTKGLLQTSELENVLGKEQARLQQDSEAVLGQARLAGSAQDISAISDILAQRQGLQLSGLERFFSEKDAKRQEDLARQLGAGNITPSSSSGSLTGAIGGAAQGGLAGFGVGGPVGAVVGGIGGAVAGSNK